MKKLVILILTAAALVSPCYADSDDTVDVTGLENAVPDYINNMLDNPGIDDAEDVDGFADKLLYALKSELQKVWKPALCRGTLITAIALVCSAFEVFSSESSPLYMKLCGCAAISLVCIGDMNSYISIGSEALNSISLFSNALLPTLCTAGVVCGTPLTSAAKYAASALFIDIFIAASAKIILPMIYAYTGLVFANAAFGGKTLEGMCGLFKWLCTALMIVLTLAFTAYLSVSSVIAAGGDAVASKTAKAAISMALPVVGGIISDAASSVVAGAEAVRGLVGVFGLVVILAICISPFAVLGINYLILKAVSAIAGSFNSGAASLVGGIGSSFGMILALVGSAGIMMFISIISCIKAVSA